MYAHKPSHTTSSALAVQDPSAVIAAIHVAALIIHRRYHGSRHKVVYVRAVRLEHIAQLRTLSRA